ncbi:hypothetical protein DFH09DRAFT_874449, partial [Mycena vulgaris]
YYGAWNSLLIKLFPSNKFMIMPQGFASDDNRGTTDFLLSFVVYFRQIPICSIEIKKLQLLEETSARKQADTPTPLTHYRNNPTLRSLIDPPVGTTSPFAVYGLSAFGTNIAFYIQYDAVKNLSFPLPLDAGLDRPLLDVPPQIWWMHDVRTPVGRHLLRQFTQDIK